MDGSVVSSRDDLGAAAVVLDAPHLETHTAKVTHRGQTGLGYNWSGHVKWQVKIGVAEE